MTITAKELRRMVQDHIVVQKLINEGVFDDYRKGRAEDASPEALMRRFQNIKGRVDKITGKTPASTSDVPAPETFDPGAETGDTSPPETTEPVESENMIDPETQPAASEDASFKAIFDIMTPPSGYTPGYRMYEIIKLIIGLASLNKKPKEEEISDALPGFAPVVLKKYGLGELAKEAGNYPNLFKLAEEKGKDVLGWLDQYLLYMHSSNDVTGDGWDELLARQNRKLGLGNIREWLKDERNQRDPETGATENLLYTLKNLAIMKSVAKMQEIYPLIARIAISLGGQQAEEKLKDILIAQKYMKPEEIDSRDTNQIQFGEDD